DEQKVERRLVVENNKQWRAAEPVRREYLRALLARKTAPKGTLRYAVGEVLAAPERVGDGKDEILAELLAEAPSGWGRRVGPAQAARASEARLPLVLLAQVAADREQTMDVQTWRRRDPAAARYLTFLASTGYQLSEIEQRVVDEGGADQDAGTDDVGDHGEDASTDDSELDDDDAA
ncbi:MAG: chromosome partitioning protein ParB, partial [Actinomycetota bacterium]|nr:chromosome partitioning protein ParB [Actinomycetota bacterium]